MLNYVSTPLPYLILALTIMSTGLKHPSESFFLDAIEETDNKIRISSFHLPYICTQKKPLDHAEPCVTCDVRRTDHQIILLSNLFSRCSSRVFHSSLPSPSLLHPQRQFRSSHSSINAAWWTRLFLHYCSRCLCG